MLSSSSPFIRRFLVVQEYKLDEEQYRKNVKYRMNIFAFSAKQLKYRIEDESYANACRNAVCQWSKDDNQEGRKSFFEILPIDFADHADHKVPDNNQCRRSDRRDAGYDTYDRCKEQRKRKQYTYRYRRQSRSSSCSHPCAGLNISRCRAGTEQCAGGRPYGIRQERAARARKFTILKQSCLFSHTEHRSCCIKQRN